MRHSRHWTKPLRGKNQTAVSVGKPQDISESRSVSCSPGKPFAESWRRCLQQIRPNVRSFPMTFLRLRMLEDMQIRNLAVNTQESYVQQVSLFARYFNQSPEQLGPEDIRTYQVYLTKEKKVATGSILIAISALRFLYKVTLKKDWTFADIIPAPKKPQTLPVVLSPEEVLQFLACVANRKHRAILTTCYAAGLRVSESIALTPPAIDSKRMVVRVEQGKGMKDRYVMLSPKLLEILRQWWRAERPALSLFPGDMPC